MVFWLLTPMVLLETATQFVDGFAVGAEELMYPLHAAKQSTA